jgi:hypothetical protein
MKGDLNDLKKLTLDLIKNDSESQVNEKNQSLIEKIYGKESLSDENSSIDQVSLDSDVPKVPSINADDKYTYAETIEEEEPHQTQLCLMVFSAIAKMAVIQRLYIKRFRNSFVCSMMM